MLTRPGGIGRRPAAAAIWALFALTTMLAALALALNAGWLATGSQELRNSADAAALAAAGELVSDEWLRQGRPGVAELLARARESARDYAAANRTLGRPALLDIDDPNSGDLVFGSYSHGALVPADLSDPPALTLNQVNGVAVTGRRLRSRGTGVPILLGALVGRASVDMQTTSVAHLDRAVIGFRARPGHPIPLVPLGLRSDPTATDPKSWEHQVRDRNGPDAFRFDSATGFVPGADGIPEIDIELHLTPSGDPAQSNGALLTIGARPPAAQVTDGVTSDDLSATDGKLVLGAGNTLTLPGTGLGPAAGTGQYTQLRDAIAQLRLSRAVRIFPLVSNVNAGTGQATVNAFVAARVVRIEEPAGGPLRVRLQPAMLAAPTAITDPARQGVHLLPSDHLAKPRLVR
jgi:hypothetical protein